MAESESEPERDWSEVAADDAAFRTAAAATQFDGEQEAQALHSIMDGDSRTPCRTACIALGKESTLTSMRAIWEPWRARSHSELAEAVHQVVNDLDAQHLRPTGIEQRLIANADACACVRVCACARARVRVRVYASAPAQTRGQEALEHGTTVTR